jgi:hypothetical protein
VLLGFAVGAGVCVFVYSYLRERVNAPDAQGFALLIAAAFAAFVATVAFSLLAASLKGTRRAVIYALGIAIFWFGALLPLGRSAAQSSRRGGSIPPPLPAATPLSTPPASAAEQAEAAALARRGRELLVAQLRSTGDHGPLGVVPPMLLVKDEGSRVLVLNRGSSIAWISLARVRRSLRGTGTYYACALHADSGRRADGYDRIRPREALELRMGSCASAFSREPIEFRVGRQPGDTSWWSDTALLFPEGHEEAP